MGHDVILISNRRTVRKSEKRIRSEPRANFLIDKPTIMMTLLDKERTGADIQNHRLNTGGHLDLLPSLVQRVRHETNR